MIYNIPKPDLSPNFTVEDIHRIREWNYERLKDASIEERLADINTRGMNALKRLNRMGGELEREEQDTMQDIVLSH